MILNRPNSTQIEAAIHALYEENQKVFNAPPDYSKISGTIKLYEKLEILDNSLLLFYDHKKMEIIYASDNIEKITGYTSEEIKAMGFQFYLKIFHYSHMGFPFRQIKIEKHLHKLYKDLPILNRKIYLGGLKLRHKKGKILRGFFKAKTLVVNENNQPELSLIQGYDFTHLFKGDCYWIRLTVEGNTYCYLSHAKRNALKDLISPRELDVLRLVAQNKSTREVAMLLNLSKKTVDTHRKNMIARTGVVNATALIHLCKMMDIF